MKSSLVSVDRREHIACMMGRKTSKVTLSSARCSTTSFFTSLSVGFWSNDRRLREKEKAANLAERPHDISDLADWNLSVAALVVQQKCLLELCNLVFVELRGHFSLKKVSLVEVNQAIK